MEDLLPIINKLQVAFSRIKDDKNGNELLVSLPQIAVVGGQSSGKSSVIESIVGRGDFLPRGSGIVTRRPLVLQLSNSNNNDINCDKITAKNDSSAYSKENSKSTLNNLSKNPPLPKKPSNFIGNREEWAEFSHVIDSDGRPRKFFNFSEVKAEIEADTERVTGGKNSKSISTSPIYLRIVSPRFSPLTLVDLPGLTRLPVGDQPSDINQQIEELVLSYIKSPNCLILAVSAANVDIANSDALSLAKMVDPSGKRTIGVLTKLDIMDAGTDCLEVLQNKVIHLDHGYVPLVLRSQKDISDGKKTLQDSIKSEQEWFSSHPLYRNIPSGINYLIEKLRALLIYHIKSTIPNLKVLLYKRLKDAEEELSTFKTPYSDSLSTSEQDSNKRMLLDSVEQFVNEFNNLVTGKTTDFSWKQLHGPARINYIFKVIFTQSLLSDKIFDLKLTDSEIMTVIQNVQGINGGLFIPDSSFEVILKRQIGYLEMPCLECVQLVYDELQKDIIRIGDKVIHRFPLLKAKVVDYSLGVLSRYLIPTNEQVKNLIKMELSHINTNHPDFNIANVKTAIACIPINNNSAANNVSGKKSSNAPVLKDSDILIEGYLEKQGGFYKTWKKRYFKLTKDYNLYYYKDLAGIKGAIDLKRGLSIREADNEIIQIYSETGDNFHRNHKVLNLRFTGGTDKSNDENWKKFLKSAVTSSTSDDASFKPIHHLNTLPDSFNDQNVFSNISLDVQLFRSLLQSYFNIVRKSLLDMVPKAIICMMVNGAKGTLGRDLYSKFLLTNITDSELKLLLKEDEKSISKRESLILMKKLLQESIESLEINEKE